MKSALARCPICQDWLEVPLKALPGRYPCACGKRRLNLVWLTPIFPGLYEHPEPPEPREPADG